MERKLETNGKKTRKEGNGVGLVEIFDFDDIIAKHMESVLDFLRNEKQMFFHYEQISVLSWGSAVGISEEYENALMYEYWASPYYEHMQPHYGALYAISLKKPEDLLGVATARLPMHGSITRRWLNRYLKDFFALGVAHTENEYHNIPGPTKAQVTKRKKGDVAVEDSVRNAKLILAEKIPVIMPPRPWNNGFEADGLIRLRDWEEHPKLMDRLRSAKQKKLYQRRLF